MWRQLEKSTVQTVSTASSGFFKFFIECEIVEKWNGVFSAKFLVKSQFFLNLCELAVEKRDWFPSLLRFKRWYCLYNLFDYKFLRHRFAAFFQRKGINTFLEVQFSSVSFLYFQQFF